MEEKNDFSKGSVSKLILNLAVPMTLAQLINLLYNIVDRMYIGRIPHVSTMAITGLGITFPIITLIMAFANLFGMGGAPLCSIARGKGDIKDAEEIMGNSFALLIICGFLLTILILLIKKPLLYLLGASSSTFSYANGYISIYLLGSIFVMISLGMNSFINSQGFAKIGMMTILLGAVTNIILDPIFIFLFNMGVKGAALATIISQCLSAIWVLKFLTGEDAILKLKAENIKIRLSIVTRIVSLGLSCFIMSLTNCTVQIVCNVTLKTYGGDVYIGVMTIINSIREIIMMPVGGITNGSQPVLGFNYGAKKYWRVKKGIKFMSIVCIIYSCVIWAVLRICPALFIRIFSSDPKLIQKGISAINIYYFGFFMMSLQMAGQSTYLALGKSKQAIFFSLLRKIIIVVPLTLILPRMYNLGPSGVFLAEPISNFIGGIACYTTLLLTVIPHLKEE